MFDYNLAAPTELELHDQVEALFKLLLSACGAKAKSCQDG